MKAEEIKQRTDTLVSACMKVAKLLPSQHTYAELARLELIRRASDLGVTSKSLATAQVGRFFGERLNKAIDNINGCVFWLEIIATENWVDPGIISQLKAEGENLATIYVLTVKNVESKLEGL